MPRTDRPQFRVTSDRFLDMLDVHIDPPLGGEVYYTTDGSEPTTKSAKYRGPLTLTQTTLVRARATAKSPGPALGNCVERRYEKLQPTRRVTEGKINFSPLDGGPQPEGFAIDWGERVALHADGVAFGWTEPYYSMSRRKSGAAPEIDTAVNICGAWSGRPPWKTAAMKFAWACWLKRVPVACYASTTSRSAFSKTTWTRS